MNRHFEWLRLITPIAIFIVGIWVHDIRANVLSIENRLTGVESKVGGQSERTAILETFNKLITDRLVRIENKIDYLNGKGKNKP